MKPPPPPQKKKQQQQQKNKQTKQKQRSRVQLSRNDSRFARTKRSVVDGYAILRQYSIGFITSFHSPPSSLRAGYPPGRLSSYLTCARKGMTRESSKVVGKIKQTSFTSASATCMPEQCNFGYVNTLLSESTTRQQRLLGLPYSLGYPAQGSSFYVYRL